MRASFLSLLKGETVMLRRARHEGGLILSLSKGEAVAWRYKCED